MRTFTLHHGAAKPIRAVGVHQSRLLHFAHENRGWHTFKQDRTTRRAIEGLKRRGCIELSGDQFRFQYPKG